MTDCEDDEPAQVPADAVFSLSQQGRSLIQVFLTQCSEIAGREVSIDDLIEIRDAMRDDFGAEDLDYSRPDVMERFYSYLRGEQSLE